MNDKRTALFFILNISTEPNYTFIALTTSNNFKIYSGVSDDDRKLNIVREQNAGDK
jgi:hypothetical protein